MTTTWFSGLSLKLEFGWDNFPVDAIGSTAWTEETVRVRSITTNRGRNTELDTFTAGTMQVVLSNANRRFDPNYTAGTLYGKLLPMKRARLVFTYSAVDYPVWAGFVDDFPQSYEMGNKDATVTLNCTDGFKVLNMLNLPDSVWAYNLIAAGQSAWYRFGEQTVTAATLIDSYGTYNGNYNIGPTQTTSLVYGSSQQAGVFNGSTQYATVPTRSITAFPFSLECWFASDMATDGFFFTMTGPGPSSTDAAVTFGLDGSGRIQAQVASPGGTIRSVTTNSVNDGATHHVVAVFTNGTTAPVIYVDGTVVALSTASVSGTATFPTSTTTTRIGTSWNYSLDLASSQYEGTLDELLTWGFDVSADVATRYAYGTNPWDGDATGDRIDRFLDIIGWAAADRTTATGLSTVGPANIGGLTVLSGSQAMETAEQGQLFMGADGTVVFRDRHWRLENTLAVNSQATFGDTSTDLRYSDLVPTQPEQFIINHVIVVLPDGSTIEATDDVNSMSNFFERIETLTIENISVTEATDLANWRVARSANPVDRIEVLEVKPRQSASTIIPSLLALDIGSRVTVNRHPQNVGSVLTFQMLVEGISHYIDASGEWIVRLSLSAADTQTAVSALVLDSATIGLLDTNVLAY